MIKMHNVDKNSALKKNLMQVTFLSTGSNFNLSDSRQATILVPYNCFLEEIWFQTVTAITASDGIVLSICNATTDVIPLAAAGAGVFWSGCDTNHLYTAADFPADTLYKFSPSADAMISQGCLLNVTISATIGTGPFSLALLMNPAKDVK